MTSYDDVDEDEGEDNVDDHDDGEETNYLFRLRTTTS